MSDRPYARVYHEVMSDPKFDGIREDARLFGSWTLCLVVADMAYPAPAFVPPTVTRTAFRRLVECGLLDELPGHRFRVHGLETERARRSDAARIGGLASGRSRSVERPLNDRSPAQRTEANLAEPRRAEQSRDDGSFDPAWLKAWWATGRTYPPTEKQQALIDAYLRTFDVTGDQRLSDVFLRNSADPIAGLKADLEAFRKERTAEAKEAEAKRPEPPRRPARGLTGINAELAALLRQKDAERGDAA